MGVILRDATADDWFEYFGSYPANSFRGVCGHVDGHIVGLGGITYEKVPKVFMDINEEGKRYKFSMVRGTRKVIDKMKKECKICYAVADDDDVAVRFLFHFGFEFSHYGENGAVFKWRTKA